ncbi:unnamed protein product [Sphagnum tenellum]
MASKVSAIRSILANSGISSPPIPSGYACSINPLMMVFDSWRVALKKAILVKGERISTLFTGMSPHDFLFGLSEATRLEKNSIGNPDFFLSHGIDWSIL